MSSWHAQWAWLGGDVAVADVVLDVSDGTITAVEAGVRRPPAEATCLRGLTLPGLVNGHSHAFHRALRGGTAGRDFWGWRERMYAVAERLDPDRFLAVTRACFAEMAEAGISTVNEFHYLHQPHGMDDAVFEAAAQVGIRLVFLDTCYLRAGFGGEHLSPLQGRFSDGDVDGWASRASGLADRYPDAVVGAAVHSVRAVDEASSAVVAAWSRERGVPLHIHLSEQPAENSACMEATGRTPTQVCAEAGVLGPSTTVVHATHVTDGDVALLGSTGTAACLCPTTERELADGIGPGSALHAAGSRLRLGSDSNAVVDLFEEARAVELDERLASGARGRHRPADLLAAATGHAGLVVGAPADFVTVSLDNVRLAGFRPDEAASHVVFAATAGDVDHLVVGGRVVVRDGHHVEIDTVGALQRALAPLGA